jgi:fibronectin type 3 domain-containing protein
VVGKLSYNDTEVENGIVYTYQVTALNDQGESQSSDEVDAIPGTIPSEPLHVQASAGDGSINVTWEPPADDGGVPVARYNVYRGPSGEDQVLIGAGMGSVFYNDTDAEAGVQYQYSVSAANAFGEGPRSSPVKGFLPEEPQISKPDDNLIIILLALLLISALVLALNKLRNWNEEKEREQ